MKDIVRIRLGISNVYLVKGANGYILIDAGSKGQAVKFTKRLAELGISPNEINLILITHVHFDHVGSLSELKEICKCPVAVQEEEADLLRNGDLVIPPATNFLYKLVSWVGRKLLEGKGRMRSVVPDIIITNEMQLRNYGIDGKVIHTPGHTKGSVTVLLSTGEAIVGDLAINDLPFGLGPIYPPFAEDTEKLSRSWKILINSSAQEILTGHGKPFGKSLLAQKLNSR